MRVLVFEIKTVGHCVGFAAGYAAAFAEAGCETTIAVADSVVGSPKGECVEAIADDVTIHPIAAESVSYRGAEQGRIEQRELAAAIQTLAPDRVVVPTADALGDALAQGDTFESGGPSMDMVIHAVEAATWPIGANRAARWRNGLRTLRRLSGMSRLGRVLSCDPYPTIGPGAWPIRAGLCRPPGFIAHPLPPVSPLDHSEARVLLDWPSDPRLVVALGDIAPRRGIEPLIRSVAHADWPDDTTLVLAGICTDAARAAIDALDAAARQRVLVVNRYLSIEEYAAAYRAADAIWAGSPHHRGMSATQWQAAAAGRPSIVLNSHACGAWLNGRIGPGEVAVAEPGSIAKCVSNTLSMPTKTDMQVDYLKRLTDFNMFKKVLVDG